MILGGILEIILGIIGLSIVVLVHETGHYAAARAVGIRVETFSVGFGRRLLGFRRGGTDYRLSLIPLGGYCRFSGEDSFRRALEENLDRIPSKNGDFYAASPWKRILVSLSGPLANVLFSIVVLTAISWIGYQESYTEPRIILASEWSEDDALWPADRAGLQSGDLIVAVDGSEVDRFHELRRRLVFRPDTSVDLTVLREGRTLNLAITPQLDRESGTAIIGVLNWVDPVIDDVEPNSAGSAAGLQPGDVVLSVDGRPIEHTVAFFSAVGESAGGQLSLELRRDGRIVPVQLEVGEDGSTGTAFRVVSGRSVDLNGLQALGRGTVETLRTLVSTIRGLRMLFLGIEMRNAVSGPLRLISDTGSVVAAGFRSGFGPGLLWSFELMSLISVSLAFLNLLPIPVLDGGQILLFLLEILRRRPASPRSVYRYQFVGTIIVFIIAITATTGDILHFNGR